MKGERMKRPQESVRVQTFQPNEFYETLLKRKAADREVYERSFSSALKITAELYARTKAKQEQHGEVKAT